jgi:hypothetical protein
MVSESRSFHNGLQNSQEQVVLPVDLQGGASLLGDGQLHLARPGTQASSRAFHLMTNQIASHRRL